MTTNELLKIVEDAINRRIKKLSDSHSGFMEGDVLAKVTTDRDNIEIAHLNGLLELIKTSHPVS